LISFFDYCVLGTLVDAGSAFDTGVVVDNGNVFDYDGVLGTNVRACAAGSAFFFYDLRHKIFSVLIKKKRIFVPLYRKEIGQEGNPVPWSVSVEP
jgi:hypothetical protein